MESRELNTWKGRIERSYALQQRQHKIWNDGVDLYNCVYFEKMFPSSALSERVDVNFANWYISNLIPLVYFRDPFIFVRAGHDKYSGFAETMENVINYLWRELGLKQEFKRVIMSSFLMPPGWMKLGYTAKIGQDVAKLEEEKQKTLIQGIKDSITGIFRKEPATLLPEEQGVLNEYIKEENIFANWLSSWNVLMAEGYQVIHQMPYLIEVEDLPKIDFMNNPFYKNKDEAKPTREVNQGEEGKRLRKVTYLDLPQGEENETNIIRLYHVWDRRTQRRFTISRMANDTHFEGKWPYDMEGFPFKPLYFEESLPTEEKSNPYPPNVIQPILPQLIEKSMSRTQMVKHRKRAAAIILAQRGLVTEEDMRQMEESDSIELKLVSDVRSFVMTQTPPLPADVYNIDEIIDKDLQMGTNMGQMMFQAQAGQRTATQAQIGQSGLQLKASGRVDCVEDFTMMIAKSLAQLAWQFYDIDKVTEITGEDVTEAMWPTLPDDPDERKRIIQAELQIKIDAGSTAPPKDETVDRKQMLDLVSIVANIAPDRIKKGPFIEQLLKKFKFAKELSRVVITGDEDEQKVAMSENQLLSQNMPQEVGPNELHEIHVQVHSQLPPSEVRDMHISKHGMYLGINPKPQGGGGQSGGQGQQQAQQDAGAQEGDMRPPQRSTNPEIARQGIPTRGDLMQSAQNLGVGTGREAI